MAWSRDEFSDDIRMMRMKLRSYLNGKGRGDRDQPRVVSDSNFLVMKHNRGHVFAEFWDPYLDFEQQ